MSVGGGISGTQLRSYDPSDLRSYELAPIFSLSSKFAFWALWGLGVNTTPLAR